MTSLSRWITILASAVAAAAFTHGLVFSAVHFDDPSSLPAYQAIFRPILVAAERLWSQANGWQPMSHIRDFGAIYTPLVELLCPLAGFALFCVLSRRSFGRNFLKPFGLAFLSLVLIPASDSPWTEMARTVGVLLLMVWSTGVRFPSCRATA